MKTSNALKLQVVRVVSHDAHDPLGQATLANIQRLGIPGFDAVRTVKVYRVEPLYAERADFLARELFCEALTHEYTVGKKFKLKANAVIEVSYKRGVMNPEAASIVKAAHDKNIGTLQLADTSVEYHFFGAFTPSDLEKVVAQLLVNPTTQMVVTEEPTTLAIQSQEAPITTIAIRHLTGEELDKLSKDRQLHLNRDEMLVLQRYFREIGRDPRDAEVEVPGQTWSEHCGHKTFKAKIRQADGAEKAPLISRIMEEAGRHMDGILSAFEDNAGVMEFYDGYAISAKKETHNSPSNLEPYGGAATGTGGVLRDIAGTGLGGRNILSTNIYCLARIDLPQELVPAGCLHPSYFLPGVVAGVRDYGNRMGVPTAHGSVHFHDDFRAKATVLVGGFGIMPVSAVKKGEPRAGDFIITVGGRTGRDGIHGATFSSGEMTAETATVNAAAVQIGHAIEEKRTFDALLACRDAGHIRALTDCGAGGFSSAIFEMGKDTGVLVDLHLAPLKYPLAPWEVLLSESQERMVVAVAPEHKEAFIALCRELNVEATSIGVFTDSGNAVVRWRDELLVELPMTFLHDGLPQRTMEAAWVATVYPEPEITCPATSSDWLEMCKRVLAHPDVCSKEGIVRGYDHGVQGGIVLPPFTGSGQDCPNDAVVIQPLLDKPYGMIVAHGMNPVLNRIDPYRGVITAVLEAIANLTAVGGNFRHASLIDNFIWPFPTPKMMGALDLAVDALCRMMRVFGIPFISGKDSLSSTFRAGDLVIEIPPVLCAAIMGKIPDVRRTISADLKQSNSYLVLVGNPALGMGGSIYYDLHGSTGNEIPLPDFERLPAIYDAFYRLVDEGHVLSAHDVSEGGILTTVAEMGFGGEVGVDLLLGNFQTPGLRPDHQLFNQTPGLLVAEVSSDAWEQHVRSRGRDFTIIGRTTTQKELQVFSAEGHLFTAELAELKQAWKQQPLNTLFGL